MAVVVVEKVQKILLKVIGEVYMEVWSINGGINGGGINGPGPWPRHGGTADGDCGIERLLLSVGSCLSLNLFKWFHQA